MAKRRTRTIRIPKGRPRRKARSSPPSVPSIRAPRREIVDQMFGIGSADPENTLSSDELDEEYYRALLADKDWF